MLIQEQRVLLGIHGDVGQVDRGLLRTRQLNFGLFGSLTNALHRHLVFGQINAIGSPEGRDEVIYQRLVPVVTTELVIATGGLDFDHAVANFEQ